VDNIASGFAVNFQIDLLRTRCTTYLQHIQKSKNRALSPSLTTLTCCRLVTQQVVQQVVQHHYVADVL